MTTLEIFGSLAQNFALFLSLLLLPGFLWKKISTHQLEIILGSFLGLSAIAAMHLPVVLADGISIDARTILVGLAGYSFGWRGALMAFLFSGAYRLSMGGVGATAGISALGAAALLGALWKVKIKTGMYSAGSLILFGILVSLISLGLGYLILPQEINAGIISRMFLPVLILYPLGILLYGKLLGMEYQRYQAQEALVESESRYRRITEGLSDFHYSAKIEKDGKHLLQFSPNCIKVTGFTPAEFTAKGDLWFSILHPEDRNRILERFRSIMEGSDGPPIEYRLLPKEGNAKWVRETTILFKDMGGKLVCFEGVIQDFTNHKYAEDENASLNMQLQQAQKMESIGRLAGGVAHDFNNMLGVILGHAELALAQTDSQDPRLDHLSEILKATGRSADLTRQLLAFARKQTVVPRNMDLNTTLEGMLNMIRRLIGENIELIWKPDPELWPIVVDPSQIDQIIANLCVNARDAISDVGSITLKTWNHPYQLGNNAFQENNSLANHHGDLVGISISDNGCGMDAETMIHIFEPFYTTKPLGEGTGLGLATVYGAVKQNKGFLRVDSKLDQGTTFSIFFPRHDGPFEAIEEIPAIVPHSGSETILIVEDDQAILKILTLVILNAGYNVIGAGSPTAALQLAKDYSNPIHLFLTDVVMPTMNGRDLADQLLRLRPKTKCLFMSGYTGDIIAHHGVLDQGLFFIQKPFSNKALVEQIRLLLDS